MPMPEILEVTDGTDTVSFLNERSGFVLKEWEPKIAQPKDGGVWKDSGIADGRQLAMIRYENVDEEFILAVTGENQNALYRNMRKLRALLLKAHTYWLSGFAYEPVWLAVKGKDEVYPRYSIITGWNYESESNPFHPPVGGPIINSVMDDWSLFIEHKPFWSNISPGSENAIKASNITSYDGRTLGNVDSAGTRVPTTAAEVFFTNKHLISNITDIYENDGAAWSANLLDAALPHRLLPAVPAVNDAIYFGTDTLVANSGPLSSLILDIGTAAVGVTGQWEYWNGAWVVFPGGIWIRMADNTDGFSNTGVNGVFWDQQHDWATVAVNGVTGWWVRFRVTGIAAPTGAEQQNRDIYAVTWPYIEIQDDQVTGDIPALLKMRIRNESNYDDDNSYQKYIDHLICGTRRVSRGEDFSAYVPLADTQLLTGQTVTLAGNAIYINDMNNSARYRSVQCNAGIGNGSAIYTTLDNTIANQYTGRFHMYLRYGGGGDWEVQIETSSFGNRWRSDIINPPRSDIDPGIADFGTIDLPPAGFGNNETVEELIFWISLDHISGATTFELYNIILLPVDEWAGSFYGYTSKKWGEYGPMLWGTNYLDIDSVTNSKRPIYSPVRIRTSGNLESQWTNSAANPATLELERRTRIWFITLSPEPPIIIGEKYFNQSYSHSIQLSTAQRYLSAIGESL